MQLPYRERWVGLIPPIPHLKHFGNGDFHPVLSHLVITDKDYRKHYADQAAKGAYILIDNSAHENGAGHGIEDLLVSLEHLNPKPHRCQVVMPDTLDNGEATARNTIEAWNQLLNDPPARALYDKYMPDVMYVPQGKDRAEWDWCFQYLTRTWVQTFPDGTPWIIGISKDYEKWWGGVLSLINRTVAPTVSAAFIHRPHLHLLGWGHKLWALRDIIKRSNVKIRSTDSAKPFVFALAGIKLQPYEKAPPYPKRPANYFYTTMTKEQQELALYNSWVFQVTARSGRYARPNLYRQARKITVREAE